MPSTHTNLLYHIIFATKNREPMIAAESFEAAFDHVSDWEFHPLFGSLLRFAEFDDAQSRTLLAVYWPMSREYPHDTWPKPTPKMNAEQNAGAISFMRGMVHRLCERVEAFIHALTHFFSTMPPLLSIPILKNASLRFLGFSNATSPA